MPTATLPKASDCVSWTQFATETSAEGFCQGWLGLQCDSLPEVQGALVLLGPPDAGPYAAVAARSRSPRTLHHLTSAAEQALQSRSSLCFQRQVDGDPHAPWTEWVEVAYPIEVAGRLYGVVVFEIVSSSTTQLPAILQRLSLGIGWLEVWLHRQRTAERVTDYKRLQVVLDALATLVERQQFYEAAAAFVTDLTTRLGCERVSLGFVRGRRVHLATMSHSAQFDKKTNLTRAIEDAMDEALDQEVRIVYPPLSNATFQMTRTHEALAQQQGLGAICSVPLAHGGHIIGVLTFERAADKPFDASTAELCDAIAALAGPVLEEKRRDQRWLLIKAGEAWRAQLMRLIGPRHVALKLVTVGLTTLITFFAVARADYRVAATTFIEARTQRVAVAPFEGYIAEAHVRPGDLVETGDLLCTLDDRDLKLELLKWQSQKEQYVKQYHLAMAQGDAASTKIIKAQIAQVEAELTRMEDQLTRTQVRAPFDGVIVSGDLSQSIGTPVERGQVLFKVAPLDRYRIIVQVDERDTADLRVGQRGNLVLSAFPTQPLPFTVEKITPVSTARDGRNYFRVEAQLADTPTHLRPGMEGVGKIDIGRRLLIWTWTHRAIDWLRLMAWSWGS